MVKQRPKVRDLLFVINSVVDEKHDGEENDKDCIGNQTRKHESKFRCQTDIGKLVGYVLAEKLQSSQLSNQPMQHVLR